MPTAIPSPILGSESKSLLDATAGNTTTGVARSSQVNSHRPVQLKLDLRERSGGYAASYSLHFGVTRQSSRRRLTFLI